jgi:hypothetical protein
MQEGRPTPVYGTCPGIYQGTRNKVPEAPTLESSASARISTEGVGQPFDLG